MNRTLVALAATILLTACGNGEPTPSPTLTVTAEPDSQSAAEEEFVYDIQSNGMTDRLAPVPQKDVIELGYLVCKGFEQGASSEEIALVMINGGLHKTDALLIVASASVNLCPEYISA